MSIQWENKNDEEDYIKLSKLRDKYIYQINDFLSTKKSSVTKGVNLELDSMENHNVIILNLKKFIIDKQYVISELPDYLNEVRRLLVDELNCLSEVSLKIKYTVLTEFDFYIKGVLFSMQSELS